LIDLFVLNFEGRKEVELYGNILAFCDFGKGAVQRLHKLLEALSDSGDTCSEGQSKDIEGTLY